MKIKLLDLQEDLYDESKPQLYTWGGNSHDDIDAEYK